MSSCSIACSLKIVASAHLVLKNQLFIPGRPAFPRKSSGNFIATYDLFLKKILNPDLRAVSIYI